MSRPLDRSDDRGTTLVFVLVIVTLIALVGASMLSFADTNIRTTIALRDQGAEAYAADGAAKVVLDTLQRGSFNNADGTKCFGATDTMLLSGVYPGQNAGVWCVPDPDSGAASGGVPINPQNAPGNAIQTLGTDPDEIGINATAGYTLRVKGAVRSNSNLKFTSILHGSFESNAGIYAHTGCSGYGSIHGNPVDCDAPTTPDPGYRFEPAYGSPANAVPDYQPVPANTSASCPGKVVTFEPGYYDDAAALTSLMSGGGSCAGSVWWFQPGIYYFDFHNTQNPLLDGSDVWTVDSGQLVAGTPTSADGQVLAKPSYPARMPGSCQSPLKSTSAQGVQFIFGGDSRFRVTDDADAEICGSYYTGRPPVAIYGLSSGDDTQTAVPTLKPSSVVSTGTGFSGVTATNLANVDTSYATLSNGRKYSTYTFTLGGYAPAAAIPAGSMLNSATLKVYFKKNTSVIGSSRTVTITPTGGSPISVPLPYVPSGSYSASVDLGGDGTTDLAEVVHDYGFTGATAKYSTKLNQNGNEYVDAIQLELTYTAPAFRAETDQTVHDNCLAETYTGGYSGGCALLSRTLQLWPFDFGGHFFIQGTTYAPIAPVDLSLGLFVGQISMASGVVARTFWVEAWTLRSPDLNPDLIQVPQTADAATIVYLEVWVCPEGQACGSKDNGKVLLRARVAVSPPQGGTRQVKILSWSMLR